LRLCPGAWLGICLAFAFVAGFLLAPVTYADAPIQVIWDQHHYVFSESLSFELEAKSDRPIIEVVLFFGQDGERLVRRVYPEFVPATQVQVTYTETLESGQYAPGTWFRTWWQLSVDNGDVLTTDPTLFEYRDDNHDWQLISGERADLLWYGRDEAEARMLSEKADEAISRLETEIGISIDTRVQIYAYQSDNDMSRALSRRGEGYDDRVRTLGVAVDEDTLLLLAAHRDAELVLAHELSHIVVGIAIDNPYTDLPRWLDEGLAMLAEGELPSDNRRALEKAIRADKLLSIRSMTSYSGQAEQVDLYYGEVYSVIDFMLDEYGRDEMRQLLLIFSEGVRQEEALQRAYGFGLDELDVRWRASLGLGPRQELTSETESPVAVEGQRPEKEKAPLCVPAAGALLLPLIGVAWIGEKLRAGVY
jgi:hypothetical protein